MGIKTNNNIKIVGQTPLKDYSNLEPKPLPFVSQKYPGKWHEGFFLTLDELERAYGQHLFLKKSDKFWSKVKTFSDSMRVDKQIPQVHYNIDIKNNSKLSRIGDNPFLQDSIPNYINMIEYIQKTYDKESLEYIIVDGEKEYVYRFLKNGTQVRRKTDSEDTCLYGLYYVYKDSIYNDDNPWRDSYITSFGTIPKDEKEKIWRNYNMLIFLIMNCYFKSER